MWYIHIMKYYLTIKKKHFTQNSKQNYYIDPAIPLQDIPQKNWDFVQGLEKNLCMHVHSNIHNGQKGGASVHWWRDG